MTRITNTLIIIILKDDFYPGFDMLRNAYAIFSPSVVGVGLDDSEVLFRRAH